MFVDGVDLTRQWRLLVLYLPPPSLCIRVVLTLRACGMGLAAALDASASQGIRGMGKFVWRKSMSDNVMGWGRCGRMGSASRSWMDTGPLRKPKKCVKRGAARWPLCVPRRRLLLLRNCGQCRPVDRHVSGAIQP